MRNAVISSNKKNTEGRYHRYRKKKWTNAQCERMAAFNDALWSEYLTRPRLPEGAVNLIIGDSLVSVLTRIQSLEKLEMMKRHAVNLMMGFNDVSQANRGK